MSEPAGAIVFLVAYVAITARRLGFLPIERPVAALSGAVVCVGVGALAPDEALAAVDGHTLLLLLGMMGMGAFLGGGGFFERAADLLARRARTPGRLLAALIWGAGALSALITNDAVCVLATPLMVELIRRHELPAAPFLIGLCTAANTGSAATLVGNPQNMLCASFGGLEYLDYLLLAGPVALAGLALNHGLVWLLYRKRLGGVLREAGPGADRSPAGSGLIPAAVIGGTAILYGAGTDLAWTAAAGFAALFLLCPRQPAAAVFGRIDWAVLLFFAGLFVVVEGFTRSGVPAWLFGRWPLPGLERPGDWLATAGVFVAGSNLVSNVPFILVIREQMALLPDPRLGYELLAVISTFAGNLMLLGSVANVIVAERSREVGSFGFLEHLKVGVPLTVLTCAAAVGWFLLVTGS
jgi:Na+/H+ antiporter NhaD/arsenite permease-like protein